MVKQIIVAAISINNCYSEVNRTAFYAETYTQCGFKQCCLWFLSPVLVNFRITEENQNQKLSSNFVDIN